MFLLAVVIVPAFIIGGEDVPKNGLKWGTHWGLNWIGAPPVEFEVVSVTLERVELSDIRFGDADGPTIANAVLGFNINDAQVAKLSRLSASGIRANISVTDQGIEIQGFSEWLAYLQAGGGDQTGPGPSIDDIQLRDIEITATYDSARVTVAGDADGRLTDNGGIDLATDLQISGNGYGAIGQFGSSLSLSNGNTGTSISGRINDGIFSHGSFSAKGVTGPISLALASGSEPNARVDLALDTLDVPGSALSDVGVSGSLEQGDVSLSVALSGAQYLAVDLAMQSPDRWPYRLNAKLDQKLWPVLSELTGNEDLKAINGNIDLTLRGRLPRDLLVRPDFSHLPSGLSGYGSVAADLSNDQAKMSGRFAMNVAGGTALIEALGPVSMSISELPAAETVAEALSQDPKSPVTVDLKPGASILLSPVGAVRIDLEPTVRLGDLFVSGPISVGSTLSELTAKDGPALDVTDARLVFSTLAYGGHDIALGQLTLGGKAGSKARDLKFRGAARITPTNAPDFGFNGMVGYSGTVRGKEDVWTLDLTGAEMPSGGLELKEQDLEITLGETRLSGRLTYAPGQIDGTFQAHVADANVEGIPVDGSGLSAKGAFALAGDQFSSLNFSADLATLQDRQVPPRFSDLALSATGNSQDGRALEFAAALSVKGKEAGISLGGGTEIGGAGTATIKTNMSRFDPGIFQPGDISPAYGSLISDVTGRVNMTAKLGWTGPDGAFPATTDIDLSVENLSFSGGFGAVTGLSTALRFDGLDPVSTPGMQEITVDQVLIGAPLNALSLKFGADKDGIVNISNFAGEIAGGKVSTADLAIPIDSDHVEIPLRVDNIKLREIGRFADVAGLSLTGDVSGIVPLVWSKDRGFRISESRLSAAAGGNVIYRPNPVPPAFDGAGDQVGLMLNALRDFRYDDLELVAEGAPLEEFRIGMRLSGSNPELYDGYPLEFNLSLTGRLDELFKANLRTQQLPDRIEEMMRLPKE